MCFHVISIYYVTCGCAVIWIFRWDDLGDGRGQCITQDSGRFVEAKRKHPERILRRRNHNYVLNGDRPPNFDTNGVPYIQFVTDSQHNLIQPLLKLLSRSLNLRRLPSCVGKDPVEVWKTFRSDNKKLWRLHRKCRIALRNGIAMVFGGREITNKIETCAWNWAPVMYKLMKEYPGFTFWDLNEQILEQFHDVRNHLYSVVLGCLLYTSDAADD